jgi:hypothetical protein
MLFGVFLTLGVAMLSLGLRVFKTRTQRRVRLVFSSRHSSDLFHNRQLDAWFGCRHKLALSAVA